MRCCEVQGREIQGRRGQGRRGQGHEIRGHAMCGHRIMGTGGLCVTARALRQCDGGTGSAVNRRKPGPDRDRRGACRRAAAGDDPGRRPDALELARSGRGARQSRAGGASGPHRTPPRRAPPRADRRGGPDHRRSPAGLAARGRVAGATLVDAGPPHPMPRPSPQPRKVQRRSSRSCAGTSPPTLIGHTSPCSPAMTVRRA